ncbi:endosome-associated-trafficking regulator 1-like isoform X1 [Nycticebus coucang]|uniref:endosome-associated-trafficking regulator 1-like isoform X1 n=1 Tax=Nycticebus coucang TaxID=9470 RepID=UPI00234E1293|nr:endosome-associated-trafficking regulator 1-like isoform X1 [Nycticebus coucang]
MSGYPRCPGATPLSRARSLVIPDDDKLEDLEEANPFSFKEFLKTKNLSLSKEDVTNRIYSKEAARHSVRLDHNSPTNQPVGYGLEYQQPFFEDPTGAGDLLDEEEDEDDGWTGSYLPSAMEQTHSARVTASTSPCGTYLSFFSTPSELTGPKSLPSWTLSDTDSRVSPGSPTGSPGTDFAAHGESLGDRHLRTLQISYEAVSEGLELVPGTKHQSEQGYPRGSLEPSCLPEFGAKDKTVFGVAACFMMFLSLWLCM